MQPRRHQSKRPPLRAADTFLCIRLSRPGQAAIPMFRIAACRREARLRLVRFRVEGDDASLVQRRVKANSFPRKRAPKTLVTPQLPLAPTLKAGPAAMPSPSARCRRQSPLRPLLPVGRSCSPLGGSRPLLAKCQAPRARPPRHQQQQQQLCLPRGPCRATPPEAHREAHSTLTRLRRARQEHLRLLRPHRRRHLLGQCPCPRRRSRLARQARSGLEEAMEVAGLARPVSASPALRSKTECCRRTAQLQ